MPWLSLLLQIDSTKIVTASDAGVAWTTLPPFLSLLTAIANLLLAVYIFKYTRRKNDADTKIKWFLELVYNPNKEVVWIYFAKLQTIVDFVPKDGHWTEQQKIDLMQFIKEQESVYSVDDDPAFRDVDPPAKQAIRVRA